MTILAFRPTWPSTCVVRPADPAVYVDGRRRRDLHVESILQAPAPSFGQAVVAVEMSDRYRPGRSLEDTHVLPRIGGRLLIVDSPVAGRALFDGIVTKHLAEVGPDREQLGAEAEDLLACLLSGSLLGRWQAGADAAAFVATAECVFNDDGPGLASQDAYLIGGRDVHVFASDGSGQPWSVSDMLGYLLAAHVPSEVAVAGWEHLDGPAAAIFPSRLSLTGLTVAESLVHVAALAGLTFRSACRAGIAGSGLGLVLYRPGSIGRRRTVALQGRGETLDVDRTNLWKGRLSFRRRPARRGVVVLGGVKRYESTFELQPGWDLALATYHYRQFVRSEAADWAAVADVFRKWVLNESGAYCDEPYSLEAFDFSTVSEADFLIARPRCFQPCLSLGPAGESLGVVVEVSCDDGETWLRHGGSVHVCGQECAIRLADDALPANYFQAMLTGTGKVRVTATVASDRRLSVFLEGDAGTATCLIEQASAQWAKVHPDSIFYQDEDLPEPAERDDSNCLEQVARAASEVNVRAVEAELTLAATDPNYNVGDIIERVDGRGLSLGAFPGFAPHVGQIEHRFGEQWTTQLIVSA